MTAICVMALFFWNSQGNAQQRLEELSRARANFEKLVTADQSLDRFAHIFSMFHETGSNAFYPVGVSDRRYMVATFAGGSGELIFESMHGKKVRIDWTIPYQSTQTASNPSGTLGLMFTKWGCQLLPKTKYTRAQIDSLVAVKGFAGYSWHPIMGASAYYVQPDGTHKRLDKYELEQGADYWSYLPIVAEEAEALGLGKERWHGPGNDIVQSIELSDKN